jgi:hypothetical protein
MPMTMFITVVVDAERHLGNFPTWRPHNRGTSATRDAGETPSE